MTVRTFLTGTAVSVALGFGMASTAQAALVSIDLPKVRLATTVQRRFRYHSRGAARSCNVTVLDPPRVFADYRQVRPPERCPRQYGHL